MEPTPTAVRLLLLQEPADVLREARESIADEPLAMRGVRGRDAAAALRARRVAGLGDDDRPRAPKTDGMQLRGGAARRSDGGSRPKGSGSQA